MADTSDHHGHRQRLRKRFLTAGPDALADYELLELLLFAGIARRDTKKLAKTLIDKFGSYAGVLHATPEELCAVDGISESSAAILKSVEAAAQRLVREEVIKREVLGSWDRLLDYLQMTMAHQKIEQLRVLFLDAKNALIRDEVQQRGTVTHTTVYPREVIKRALELGASAIIIVHNHPSGDTKPSTTDIEMTRELKAAGDRLGIALHDHVIVGKGGHASFKSLGLL